MVWEWQSIFRLLLRPALDHPGNKITQQGPKLNFGRIIARGIFLAIKLNLLASAISERINKKVTSSHRLIVCINVNARRRSSKHRGLTVRIIIIIKEKSVTMNASLWKSPAATNMKFIAQLRFIGTHSLISALCAKVKERFCN